MAENIFKVNPGTMKTITKRVLLLSITVLLSAFCNKKEPGWYVGSWVNEDGQTVTITADDTLVSSDDTFEGILMGFQYTDEGNIFCSLCEEGTKEEEFLEDSGSYTLFDLYFDKLSQTLEIKEPSHGMLLSVYHKMQEKPEKAQNKTLVSNTADQWYLGKWTSDDEFQILHSVVTLTKEACIEPGVYEGEDDNVQKVKYRKDKKTGNIVVEIEGMKESWDEDLQYHFVIDEDKRILSLIHEMTGTVSATYHKVGDSSDKTSKNESTSSIDISWIYGTWSITTPYGTETMKIDENGGVIDMIGNDLSTGSYTVKDGELLVRFSGSDVVVSYPLDMARHRISLGEGQYMHKK